MSNKIKESKPPEQQEQKRHVHLSENSSPIHSSGSQNSCLGSFQKMIDNSPRQLAQKAIINNINNSKQVKDGAQLQSSIDNSERQITQRKRLEDIFGNTIKTSLNQESALEKNVKEKVVQPKTEEALTVEKTTESNSTETEVDPKQIKTEDVKYELIAHGLAYQPNIPKDGESLLTKWGYQKQWKGIIDDTNSGLFAGLLLPLGNSFNTPIIAFRGTEDIKDLMADGDPYGVGYTSFMLNRIKIISELFDKVGNKKVDVVGHSLGGALAKYAAVEFPDKIRRVVTFQAPGINSEQSAQFNKLKNKPSVTCHIADGDIVDTAGVGHLNGEIYKHYRQENLCMNAAQYLPGIKNAASMYSKGNELLTHTELLLTSKKYEKQQKELLPPGWNLQQMINAVNNPEDKDKKKPFISEKNPDYYTQYPHPYKNKSAEFGRSELGKKIDPQASVLNNATNDQISEMPSYARINILKNLITNTALNNETLKAISKIIYCSSDKLILIPNVGLKNVFNAYNDQRHSNLLLNYLKGTNFYKKLYADQQLTILDDGLYSGMHKGPDVVVDLLTNIAAPEARVLISEIGRKSYYKNICTTNYNAGLHSITNSLTGSFNKIIRDYFPFD